MSWIEKLNTEFKITTGDGRSYSPDWLKATKSKEYNVSEFEFPNLAGTLVYRGTPKGRKYAIEIYFKGEDHLDFSEAFENSADDPRAWTILHPYYGSIIVQPVGLDFDNTSHNLTKITGGVIETITEDRPQTTVDPVDKITSDKDALDAVFEQSFVDNVIPDTSDINTLTANNLTLYNEGKKTLKSNLDAENYFNAFNNANSAILNATAQPLAAIRELQAVITAPALFADSVKNRIATLVNQFTLLSQTVANIITRHQKKIFENNGGCLISAMCLGSVTNYNYPNRKDVVSVADLIIDNHNSYLTSLDSLQTNNGGGPDSFIPDAGSMISLNALVGFTLSNLFNIALNSKQERSILCENDTNLILLAHRFYGLTVDDSTITAIVNNNNIGINELLQIRKGRKIIYYV